jgi:hypothetical protein
MDEDELRELQDPANWDWENAEIRSPEADVGAVVAVRFTAEEFSQIARQATEAEVSLASFVRESVLARVTQRAAR